MCASTWYEAGHMEAQPETASAHAMTQVRRGSFMGPGEEPIIAPKRESSRRRRRRRGSSGRGRGRDFRDQILCLDRLHQKVLRALAHAPDAVGFLVPARADDDRNVLGRLVVRDGPRGLVAVDSRHDYVHQDQVGLLALGLLDGLVPVLGGDALVALLGKRFHEEITLGGRIVDDQDLLSRHCDLLVLGGAGPLNNHGQGQPVHSSISKTDARYRARWHSRSAYNARLANRTDMIRLSQVTLRRGAKTLLEGADAALNPGDKIGLIGANGSGKTSLFALLRGELHADKGEADYPARWRVAYDAQDTL